MAKFFYVAKNQAGEVRNGDIEGGDEREIAENLKKEGFWIISLKQIAGQQKRSAPFWSGFMRVSLKSKMIFCRHLAVMMSSGLALSRALNIIESQEQNTRFKAVIKRMEADIKKGISFADALAQHPGVFNRVFVSMVKVGETSGNLEEILNILADQLEKDHKLVSKVRGAMIYPGIILSVMVLMGILMMILVVPKITSLFEEFNAQLPPLTRFVVAVSKFMSKNVILTFVILLGTVAGTRFFAKTEPGTKIFHKIFIKAPVIGSIITKVNSARFSRILSSLMKSGVALVESLNITSDTLGNYYYKKATMQAAKDVQKGIQLSQVLKNYENFFPHLLIQMVEVGEETGKTEQVLLKLAIFYEEEVDQITKNMSSIIEPVLMVIIGAAVGVFAISIIQPIYSLMDKM